VEGEGDAGIRQRETLENWGREMRTEIDHLQRRMHMVRTGATKTVAAEKTVVNW
jgi:hypothetical protein